MAKFLARRVVVTAAVVLAAGAVAAGVAEAAGGGQAALVSSQGSGPGRTAAVVRTDLVNTVQVGGSIGFEGSYTVAEPSGSSAAQVAQARQTVNEDRQALSGDEQAAADASAADRQAIAADQANARTARSALTRAQARKSKTCAGAGASTAACSQATQQVSADKTQLTQARQQLAGARSTARLDHDQNQAKIASDQSRLRGDRATFASLRVTAVNPGTTYTWLPEPGAVIRQDQRVYSVSDEPVLLLYGSIASYRAFYLGMSRGADVGELTHDLIALGYGDGLAQSNQYSAATAAAVERWQTAHGLPATGRILLGEVVFEPGPIQVTSVTPAVGSPVGGGGAGGSGGDAILTATGTTPIVTLALDVTQEYLVKPGDAVSVVLPNGTSTVGGHVQSVGTVATCPGGSGTGSGSSSSGQSPCSSGGQGNSSTPTVTVTITLDRKPAAAVYDQAPVNVNITSQRADHVLAVPVNALLALRGGGFGVDVVTAGGAVRLVGVTTGLYSSSLVQISGAGITAGTRVEVPSS